jgi:hypothetical protein
MNSKIGSGLVRAIRVPANMIAMALALVASLAFLNPLPFAFGLAAETIYLLFAAIRSSDVHADPGAVVDQPKPAPTPTEVEPAEPPALLGPTRAPRSVKLTPYASSDLRPDLQAQCANVDSLTRVIALQVGTTAPFAHDLMHKLDLLRSRHAQFCRREMDLRRMLTHLLEESKSSVRGRTVLPRVADDLIPTGQLVLSSAPFPENQTASEYAQEMSRQTHAEFERALAEIAWQRESSRAARGDVSELDRMSQALMKRNRYVDRVAKTLINLHYEIQLIVRKFEETRIELSGGNVEQILGDLNALLLQADSVSRTLEDLEPINQRGDAVGV